MQLGVRSAILLALLTISACAAARRDPLGRSIHLDPGFAYYQDRSKESIASEVRVNGFRAVRLMVTNDSAPDAALVDACREDGLAVWYTTIGNGKYGTAGLPSGWESWKMVLRHRKPDEVAGGFTYFCLNNPEYRAWKQRQVVETLKRVPFDGFEMAEPFWPAYKGPESESYGCLCNACRTAFLKMYPDERAIPEFDDTRSVRYYRKNPRLYRKWMEFRVQSVVSFHEEIIGAVRKNCPKVKIGVWGIADDVPDPVETLREWEGIDGEALAVAIRPDMYVIQTDWPDWSNPRLPADYPLKYGPFVAPVKSASPRTAIIMQSDIGSWENCRRGWDWYGKCERAAVRAGMNGITGYEYHLASDIYDAPLKAMEASGRGNTVCIVFNKRLDPSAACRTGNYTADRGAVVSAETDGNIVRLQVDGRPGRITVRNVADDPARRFFKNYPAVIADEQTAAVSWR